MVHNLSLLLFSNQIIRPDEKCIRVLCLLDAMPKQILKLTAWNRTFILHPYQFFNNSVTVTPKSILFGHESKEERPGQIISFVYRLLLV